jgi:hypothetical protein
MDVKWFFAIIIILVTFAIIISNFFMASYVSLQSYNQFQKQLNQSSMNFNNSKLIHESLYNNITDLKKGFDPILAVIPNATQAEQERQIHYNQTSSDFDTIKQILKIKLEDHDTLGQINKSLAILAGNVGTGASSTEPIPKPIIQCENNDTAIPIIENITGKTNSLHQC